MKEAKAIALLTALALQPSPCPSGPCVAAHQSVGTIARLISKEIVNMTTSKSKTALITGASGGIGRAVARRLAKDGFYIVVHYAGNPAKAEQLVAEINQDDGKAVAIKADVAVAAEVENLFKTSLEQFGHIDVVVHLAGIMPLFPISGGDVESFDKVIATNLRGTFLVLSQAAQRMTSNAGGELQVHSSLLNIILHD
jgi:3-oxoacyl-[acyl-carrier protein] reductase